MKKNLLVLIIMSTGLFCAPRIRPPSPLPYRISEFTESNEAALYRTWGREPAVSEAEIQARDSRNYERHMATISENPQPAPKSSHNKIISRLKKFFHL